MFKPIGKKIVKALVRSKPEFDRLLGTGKLPEYVEYPEDYVGFMFGDYDKDPEIKTKKYMLAEYLSSSFIVLDTSTSHDREEVEYLASIGVEPANWATEFMSYQFLPVALNDGIESVMSGQDDSLDEMCIEYFQDMLSEVWRITKPYTMHQMNWLITQVEEKPFTCTGLVIRGSLIKSRGALMDLDFNHVGSISEQGGGRQRQNADGATIAISFDA